MVFFSVGRTATLERTVTGAQVEAFAEVSGDNNPIHLNEGYAASSRFGRRIAHGMLVASYVSTLLGTKFPGVGTIYMSQTLTFLRPVFLGDTLTVTGTVTAYQPDKAIVTIATVVTNEAGKQVLTGEATCLVRDVLAENPISSGAAAS